MDKEENSDVEQLIYNQAGLHGKRWSDMTDVEVGAFYDDLSKLLYGSKENEIYILQQKSENFRHQLDTYSAFRFSSKLFIYSIAIAISSSAFFNIMITASFSSLPKDNAISILIGIIAIYFAVILVYVAHKFWVLNKKYDQIISGLQMRFSINQNKLMKIKNPEIVKQEWAVGIKHEKTALYLQTVQVKEKELKRKLNAEEVEQLTEEASKKIDSKYADRNPLSPFEQFMD